MIIATKIQCHRHTSILELLLSIISIIILILFNDFIKLGETPEVAELKIIQESQSPWTHPC